MVRYVKQRDETSCGPVAIINVLKWMGYKVSYDFIHTARYLCNWEDTWSADPGATDLDVERALKKLDIKKKRRIKPTLKEIDKHIDSGGIILLGYYNVYSLPGFKLHEGHYSLCIGRTKKTYIMVNDLPDTTVGKRHRSAMQRIVNNKVNGRKCWAWFISK